MENVSSIQILSAQEYLMYSLPRTLQCAIAYAWAQGDVEILIEVFTMEDLRNPSLRIWKLLKRASEVGATVKILLDKYGCNAGNVEKLPNGKVISHSLSESSLERYRRSGIEIVYRKATAMSHRKQTIVSIGGKTIAFVGGTNLLAGYETGFEVNGQHINYTDKQVKLEGQICKDLRTSFSKMWQESTKESLPIWENEKSTPALNAVNAVSKTWTHVPTEVLPTSGWRHPMEAEFAIRQLIKSAKKEIIIRSPYIALSPALISALRAAKKRGVKIMFISGMESDLSQRQEKILNLSAKICCKLAKAKLIKNPGYFHHDKLIVIDRETVLVGSMNTDLLSLFWLYELSLCIHDDRVANQFLELLSKECPIFRKAHYL